MLVEGKKVLVLGLGVSGLSAVHFLLKKGAFVSAFDRDKSKMQAVLDLGIKTFDEESEFDFGAFDFVVASPGFPVKEKKDTIIGEMELGARFLKNRAIGITGTNGKTTVTLLVEHVLNHCGLKAKSVGNVGTPLTDYLLHFSDIDEILVVELSSYQLETLECKIFDAGVILNITPDHLDRYRDLDEYAMTKIRLLHCMKNTDFFYVNEDCFKSFEHCFQSAKINQFGYSKDLNLYSDLENVYLNRKFQYTLPCDYMGRKSHEIENMMAAYFIVKQFHVTAEQFLEAFITFEKPSHRIEFVREVNSVLFYDDSKGTNIDAVMKAVVSLKNPLYLIAGGVDKGSSYAPWKSVFKDKVKGVMVIGEAAQKIRNELMPDIEVEMFDTLESAVYGAYKKSASGDAVLLSPGCSSYDMFKDYKERGNEFKRIVNLLSKS